MSFLPSLRSKLRAVFFKRKLDAEMAEEMRVHMQMQEDLNRAAGMNKTDAHLSARRQFGHLDGLQEKARDGRGVTWLLDLFGDVRFALRMIGKHPGFAITVVLTLAFGIATNTQIFAMINMFYLRPLPVQDPHNLVLIGQRSTAFNMPHGISFSDFRDYRDRLTNVDDMIAFYARPINFSSPGQSTERVWAELVTPDAFTTLGVPALIGRTLVQSDGEGRGGQPVAMVSHLFWKNRLGADPGVVGRHVMVNGKPFTIVGVAAEGFNGFGFSLQMDLFVPSGVVPDIFTDGLMSLENRGVAAWKAMGRLKPDTTFDAAQAEMLTVAQAIASDHPVEHKGVTALMVRETRARPDLTVSDLSPLIVAMFSAMVILVLFIACANVANLMLARAMTRQREFALRSAVGATRLRLIRQMLVESTILALIAGLAAWLLSSPLGQLLAIFAPQGDVPPATQTAPDWRNLLFVPVISLLAGIVSGLLPALKGSRTDLLTTIKAGAAGNVPGEKHRLRNMLVIGQVAMSLVVLVGAGLFTKSLRKAQTGFIGFNADRLFSASFDLDLQGYDSARSQNFMREVLAKTQALPDVEDAALVQHMPFGYASVFAGIWPELDTPHLKDGTMAAGMTRVSGNYFNAMDIPLLKGRAFESSDRPGTPTVVVVNDMLAQTLWPGQDALGKRFRMWNTTGPMAEVIGIVPTGKYQMIGESPRPFFFVSLEQDPVGAASLMVRARRDPNALISTLRATVQSLDPHLPVYGVRTMQEHLRSSVFGFMPLRAGAALASLQGAVGLFLAVMGLYAVVSYSVTQRTREIGVRMALGAPRDSVTRLVVREGLRLTLIGLGLGALFAIGLGFGLSKILYALPAFDMVVFGAVVAVLLLTTLFACWLPARRAAGIDPMRALRAE